MKPGWNQNHKPCLILTGCVLALQKEDRKTLTNPKSEALTLLTVRFTLLPILGLGNDLDQLAKRTFRTRYARNRLNDRWTQSQLRMIQEERTINPIRYCRGLPLYIFWSTELISLSILHQGIDCHFYIYYSTHLTYSWILMMINIKPAHW